MARKSITERIGLDEAEFNKLYIKSKIAVSPYDYTLKDRAIVIKYSEQFATMASIFSMGTNTEATIADKLGLRYVRTGLSVKSLGYAYDASQEAYLLSGYDVDMDHEICAQFYKNPAFFHKHNDLLINEVVFNDLIEDLGAHKVTFTKKAAEAMMKLQVILTGNESIIPQLTLTRIAETDGMSLKDVSELKFVTDGFGIGLDRGFSSWFDKYTDAIAFLMPFAMNRYLTVPKHSFDYSDTWTTRLHAEILKQNVICAAMYFCEVCRAFKTLDQDSADAIAIYLFGDYRKRCGKPTPFLNMFGKYNMAENRLDMHPELEEILSKSPAERFHEIPAYVDKMVSKYLPDMLKWDESSYTTIWYAMDLGEFLIRIFGELHHYSWQDFRIRHYIALIEEAKRRKVDLGDLKAPRKADASSALLGSVSADDDADAPVKDFGDMSDGDEYGDDDFEAPTPEGDKPKAKPSNTMSLETMDNLIKGCDTRYDIDVQDVIASIAGRPDAYRKILDMVDMITKQLTKQIREIKTYNTGGKHSGKSRGKIDPHTMYRYKTDPKIFYDNTYKVKEMDLAFGIILDQSGSMAGDGISNGRIALILLHHVLNALRINHSIIGHTSSRTHHVKIMRYVLFNEDPKHTLNVPYTLANIGAHTGNCDSGALNYMEQYIKRTRNKDKIVLIFSDGEPTECSETELKQQVRKMEAEGIHVIGLGINFENIKLYYPDHANGKNMKEMIDVLVEILKRYVLEKKD